MFCLLVRRISETSTVVSHSESEKAKRPQGPVKSPRKLMTAIPTGWTLNQTEVTGFMRLSSMGLGMFSPNHDHPHHWIIHPFMFTSWIHYPFQQANCAFHTYELLICGCILCLVAHMYIYITFCWLINIIHIYIYVYMFIYLCKKISIDKMQKYI